MNINKFGKMSIALICALFICVIAMPAATLNAAGGLKIDSKNFPDGNLRKVVKSYDSNRDGKLSSTEINNIIYLSVVSQKVSNLKGIEKLTNLQSLYCSNNNIKSLDVSKNTKLRHLSCANNKITSITGLGNLKDLSSLYCSNNAISSLDVSKNTNLSTLECSGNKLSKVKGLENLKDLKYFYCEKNNLTSLDLSKHTQLVYISCSNNKISSLKLPKGDDLIYLYCSDNKITSLDVSDYLHLSSLKCSNNAISKLVVNNPSLVYLYCSNNKLTKLDLSETPALRSLQCSGNKIKTLDVSSNKLLTALSCHSNGMTSLEFGKCKELITLYCNDNKLKSLDLASMKDLLILLCQNNKLTELDVKDNEKLTLIDCVNNDFDYAHIGLVASGKESMMISSYVPMELLESATESADLETEALINAKKVMKLVKEAVNGTGSVDPAPTPKPTTWKVSNSALVSYKPGTDSGIVYATLTGKQAGLATIKCTVDGKTTKFKAHVLYKDVTDRDEFWFEPTRTMTELGVVKGYNKQTEFRPGNECTRAQMVTFIWRLKGEPAPMTMKCPFSDVKKTDYFYKAVIWGNEKGIVEGYKDGTFGPQKLCQRKHAVTFLWRLAGSPAPKPTKNKFKDIKKSDYFYQPVLWASEKKIVAGYSDGTFKPNGNCLRRQMVTFLYKYDKFVNGED